jgi:hypothetical protein
VNIYEVRGWDPKTYLETRGQEDVTETLQVIWADHCPPEKIYGYHLLWKEQFTRTQHPLCKELSDFFEKHIPDAAKLSKFTIFREIQNNGQHHTEMTALVQEVASMELAPIPDGPWQEKLENWSKNLHDLLQTLNERESNPDLDKLKRELTDEHEKVEALLGRLMDTVQLPDALEQAWAEIKSYVETRFENDETDYEEQRAAHYDIYRESATALVESVSKRMPEYHEMMALAGSMTEGEKRGCETYLKALELHWERKWDESIAMFQKVLEDIPGDKAAQSFIERIEGYKETPPPASWQGQFAQTKK